MVEYVCPDCNESFDHKSKFDQHRRRKKPCTPAAGGSQETQIQKVCACGRQYAPGGGFYAHAKKCESAIKAAVIKSAPSFLKQLQPLKTQLQNAPVDSSLRETLRSLLVSENAIKELQSDQQAADEASHSVVRKPVGSEDLSILQDMDFACLKKALKLTGAPTEAMLVAMVQQAWLNPHQPANLNIYANPDEEHALVYRLLRGKGHVWVPVPREQALRELLSCACVHYGSLEDTLRGTAPEEGDSSGLGSHKLEGLAASKYEALDTYLVESEGLLNDTSAPLPREMQKAVDRVCNLVFRAWAGKLPQQAGGSSARDNPGPSSSSQTSSGCEDGLEHSVQPAAALPATRATQHLEDTPGVAAATGERMSAGLAAGQPEDPVHPATPPLGGAQARATSNSL